MGAMKGRFPSRWFWMVFVTATLLAIFTIEDVIYIPNCSVCVGRSEHLALWNSTDIRNRIELENLEETQDGLAMGGIYEVLVKIGDEPLEGSSSLESRSENDNSQVKVEEEYNRRLKGTDDFQTRSGNGGSGVEQGALEGQAKECDTLEAMSMDQSVGFQQKCERLAAGESDKVETRQTDVGSSGQYEVPESRKEGTFRESQVEGQLESSLGLRPSSDRSGSEATSPSSSFRTPVVKSVRYYTKVYEHPEAKLRVLTAEDGAARLRSSRLPREREITIVTQTSADRFQAVEATCMRWGGPMCIAVHVRLKSDIAPVYELLEQAFARAEQDGRCRLDIQLVTEDGFETEEEALNALYPVNALRNVALGMADSKLIFLLDADFTPSSGLHQSLTEDQGTYQKLLRQATEEQQLFVVPAFESRQNKRLPQNLSIPKTKEELREGWNNGKFYCFHCVKYPTGHMPTDFKKYFDPGTTSPYSIPYRAGFEPYVIGFVDSIPLYDARFRGYGDNKVSHIYSCAAAGMRFQVLPNAFVFELPHPPSKAHEMFIGPKKDPSQRPRIIGLYRKFQNELAQREMEKNPIRFQQFLEDLRSPLNQTSS